MAHFRYLLWVGYGIHKTVMLSICKRRSLLTDEFNNTVQNFDQLKSDCCLGLLSALRYKLAWRKCEDFRDTKFLCLPYI